MSRALAARCPNAGTAGSGVFLDICQEMQAKIGLCSRPSAYGLARREQAEKARTQAGPIAMAAAPALTCPPLQDTEEKNGETFYVA
ncbi:MAG: hypothetical protein FWG59_03625 [Betaproteobacteria bacterium]|nr:hypothetical protein [Betaproteobacteria bacterium]